MPRPVTVYKDGKSASSVYPSELQFWFEQGWALEPQVVPEQPKQYPIVVGHSRQKELEDLGWRELKAIASEYGIEKTDSQTWGEIIPDILKAENR